MDRAITHYFNSKIVNKEKLSGGFSFETWLVTLEDGRKLVFRTASDYTNTGGRRICMADIFRRERFFYETMNSRVDAVFPVVHVIDDSLELYDKSFMIYSYLEGDVLSGALEKMDLPDKERIYRQIGRLLGRMHGVRIDSEHPFIAERGSWAGYIAQRLGERLIALINNGVVTDEEIKRIKSRMEAIIKDDDPLSFLHLDMRPDNLILKNDKIFVIDAENSEWGDPYFELARMNLGGSMNQDIYEGYMETAEKRPDCDTELYILYKLETAALLLNVYKNEVSYDEEAAVYMDKFLSLKKAALENC